MPIRLPIAATLVAAALSLTGCGGGGGSDSDASDKAATTTEAPSSDGDSGGGGEVKIADFAFEPDDLEVKVGDTVTFSNEDSATHTATADDDAPMSFDTEKIEGDASAEVTFDEAGDYSYYCSIHDYMKGTIRVVE